MHFLCVFFLRSYLSLMIWVMSLVDWLKSFLKYFFNWFFKSHPSTLSCWKLDFIISFDFLYIELSQSYDLGSGFDRFTRVIFLGFFLIDFCFQFHHLTLGWLKMKLYNLFWFILYGAIIVSYPNNRFNILTQVDSSQSNMLLS